MIAIYWPGKKVPAWLEKIEATEPKSLHVRHAGFGIILKYKGWFNVWGISGIFIRISGGGVVSVFGQGKGVSHYTSLSGFLKQIRHLKSQ